MNIQYNDKKNNYSYYIKRSVITLIILITLLVCYNSVSVAGTNEEVVLLSLQYKLDNTVVRKITLHGNRIDPNNNSIHDSFSLSVDGKFINVPDIIYSQLQQLRRNFSYDEASSGISKRMSEKSNCLLAGAAEGLVLEARYLTLNPESLSVIKNEMKPIFGLAINCLFDQFYSPHTSSAREDARAALEMLKTIYIIYQ